MVLSLRRETTKAAIFLVIDIILVFIFTYFWFKVVDRSTKQPLQQSLYFTIFMQLFFFVYYFAYDLAWESYFS